MIDKDDNYRNYDGDLCRHCLKSASVYKEHDYGNDTGMYQEECDKINALPADKGGIPHEGHAQDNAIDIFRCAQNTYYDIMNNGACNMGMKHRQAELYQVNTVFDTPILDKTIECFENTDDNLDYIDDPDDYWADLQHEAEHMIDACILNVDEALYEDVVVEEPSEEFKALSPFQKRLLEMGLTSADQLTGGSVPQP